jgi:hypothetical protein
VSPFNDSQYRRARYNDELGTSRGGADAANSDEFMPDGTHSARNPRDREPQMFSRAKDTVQRGISGATDYVRSHDIEDVLEDARKVARRNPRVAIIAVVAVGFLIGRMLRRPR